MAIPVLKPTEWWCPACKHSEQRILRANESAMHPCPKLGLVVPLVPAAEKGRATYRINVREDYLKADSGTVDARGKVIMSVVTEHEDHTDCTVLAPCINFRTIPDD